MFLLITNVRVRQFSVSLTTRYSSRRNKNYFAYVIDRSSACQAEFFILLLIKKIIKLPRASLKFK